jgi:hypothetical protein
VIRVKGMSFICIEGTLKKEYAAYSIYVQVEFVGRDKKDMMLADWCVLFYQLSIPAI